MWWIYIIRCGDDSLYTGITIDLKRRFEEHASGGKKAAKYVRGRGPLSLVYSRQVGSQTEALAEERRIKALSRKQKETLVAASA